MKLDLILISPKLANMKNKMSTTKTYVNRFYVRIKSKISGNEPVEVKLTQLVTIYSNFA